MSPIIDLQRRLVEVGRIRAGDQAATQSGGKRPNKLDKWRLTSTDRARLDAAAQLWGGTPREWEGRAGEHELYTDTAELPILLLPGQALSQWWELWSGGGCQRRCDGERMVKPDDQPCACDADGGERKCRPTTRLSVMLPDIPGLGCWRLESHGYYAAVELAATAAMLEQATAAGQVFPARLRLEQRSKVDGGQTIRYAVPVIDIDVRLPEALTGLAAPDRLALPAGYTPIPPTLAGRVTLEQGLIDAESQTLRKPPRVPLPEDDDLLDGDGDQPEAEAATPADDGVRLTAEQKAALNALYGELTRAGAITVEQTYAAAARMRNIAADDMIVVLDGRKQNGDLSFSRLRDSLTRQEASNLIDRLGRLADKVKAGAAA